jgi:hypothetical protein
MSDCPPANRLIHTVKFRLSEPDHARLAGQAGVLRLRVNELARQLVTERARRPATPPALDPAVVIQLQMIGLRLRDILSGGACDPDLRAHINDLLLRIDQIMDHALSGEAAPWFR